MRISILGVGISAVNMETTLAAIAAWIDRRETHYICCAPAHAIMNCVDDHELRKLYNQSGLTTPDGMPIAWLLRLAGQKQVDRVYGPDLLLAACERGLSRGWRHFFYGATPEVSTNLVRNLQNRHIGLNVAGVLTPPFRPLTEEEDRIECEQIRSAHPDVLWVGTGSPRQERWMAAHAAELSVPVIVGVGAAFDFLSGAKPQAPRWMQRGGLEWAFRLFNEPRRLWKRYLLGYPRFITLLMLQALHLRSFGE